jgi:hypothetical protein
MTNGNARSVLWAGPSFGSVPLLLLGLPPLLLLLVVVELVLLLLLSLLVL